ncbi:MAG: DMSO reductase, partial [Nitrospinae bacterium]|nr:DMSO reductase [Nitrospinota bacterium]
TKTKAKSKAEAVSNGYTKTGAAFKGYVGQKIGNDVYRAFPPDAVNKSGKFEIYSDLLKDKGFSPLPSWEEAPEHKKMKSGEMILTTYKVAVHSHSRSQNCQWQTEIYHDNPAWINPKTAAEKGIKNGDTVRLKSSVGEMVTKVKITEEIHPQAIAISHHMGHWEYGVFASGKKAATGHAAIPDVKYKWWTETGTRPNWIMPNAPEPIGGHLRWMDTVVKVTKA